MLGRDVVERRIGELLGGEPCGGRALLVEGPIGVGRTTTLRLIADRAVERGYAVLSATGSRAERSVPLGVARQMVGPRSPDPVTGVPRAPDDRVLQFESVTADLLGRVGDHAGPLMFVLDDLQLADPESLELLLYLLRRVPPRSVVLVAAVQTPQSAAADSAAFLAEVSRTLRLDRLRLDRLSPDEVREHLAARLGGERVEELAHEAVALSGGSPLLLDALVEDLVHGAASGSERYARAVVAGVHRGGPVVTEVAAALAVLAETSAAADPSTGEVAQVAGVTREAAEAALVTLAEAGLPTGPGYPVTAARDAVLDRIGPARRADMHLAAAQVAREAGRPVSVVVEHLLAAGDRCRADVPWAVDALVEAADRAVLDQEPEHAARCLQVAWHHCPAGRESTPRGPARRRAVAGPAARVAAPARGGAPAGGGRPRRGGGGAAAGVARPDGGGRRAALRPRTGR
ncbi:ATP-binding protein [Pseudonocardia tropica]|uniref:ATP-binding protein n=1 Tax=Pseudonocardia tropica TaxID=681289 RepID=A0ABV1JYL1_9PSEU